MLKSFLSFPAPPSSFIPSPPPHPSLFHKPSLFQIRTLGARKDFSLVEWEIQTILFVLDNVLGPHDAGKSYLSSRDVVRFCSSLLPYMYGTCIPHRETKILNMSIFSMRSMFYVLSFDLLSYICGLFSIFIGMTWKRYIKRHSKILDFG